MKAQMELKIIGLCFALSLPMFVCEASLPNLAMQPPMQSPMPPHHHGLKAHLGMAVLGFGVIAGTAVGSYAGASSHHAYASTMAPLAPPSLPGVPLITVTTGHCPAAFDPAFQVPVKWWDNLAKEESSPELGPQWKLWMSAVTAVFQSHAYELRATQGVASLHIMVKVL